MKSAAEMYPNIREDNFYGPGDYDPIIEAIGQVAIKYEQEDWQGSTWVLYEGPDDTFGFLEFGWGSCSGCDALQCCSSLKEIDDLAVEMRDSVVWLSREAMIEKLRSLNVVEHWAPEDRKAFVLLALNYLGASS